MLVILFCLPYIIELKGGTEVTFWQDFRNDKMTIEEVNMWKLSIVFEVLTKKDFFDTWSIMNTWNEIIFLLPPAWYQLEPHRWKSYVYFNLIFVAEVSSTQLSTYAVSSWL